MSSRASAAITSTPSLCFSACSSSSRLDLIPATLFTAYVSCLVFFFLNDTPPPEISPLPLHAALPISPRPRPSIAAAASSRPQAAPREAPAFTGGVAAREDRVARHERVRPRRVGRRDGVGRDPAIHLEERTGAVRGEQLARPADLVVGGGEGRLPPPPRGHGPDGQQVEIGDDFFPER